MKKIFLLTLCMVMLIPLVVNAAFSDVPAGHWAETYINELTSNGVINGYPDGTFGPEGTITRAEFIKLVIADCMPDWLDITEAENKMDHWAGGYVSIAETYGVVEKGSITSKNIDEPITRMEMAKIISVADMVFKDHEAQFDKKQDDFADTLLLSYDDLYLLRHAVNRGLITGYPDGTFGPDKSMTRAEAATMIYRFTK